MEAYFGVKSKKKNDLNLGRESPLYIQEMKN